MQRKPGGYRSPDAAARILSVEHVVYPRVIEMVAILLNVESKISV